MSEALIGRAFDDASITLTKPNASGTYSIKEIAVGCDYVAIAPIDKKEESSIIVPDEEPTIGIIVGIGPMVPVEMRSLFKIGDAIKFASKPQICKLDGMYSYYGDSRIVLTRYQNILVKAEAIKVFCVK